MDKIDKYLTEKMGGMKANKRAEVRIVFAIPENIDEKNINTFIKKKFSAAIKQGGVIEYDIKII